MRTGASRFATSTIRLPMQEAMIGMSCISWRLKILSYPESGSGYPPGVASMARVKASDTHHASQQKTSARNNFSENRRQQGARTARKNAVVGGGKTAI